MTKMTIDTALGLDLGIKTGSLVQVRVDRKTNAIDSHRVLASWTKGPSIKDDLDDITRWFELNVLHLLTTERIGYDQSVAIDWNQLEIYWAANKAHSNVKTFIAGYINCHCYNNGITTNFISPAEVRSFFGFPNSKAKKEEVQRQFLTKVPRIVIGGDYDHTGYDYGNTHDLDSLILAYIQELRNREEPCPVYSRVNTQG